MPNSPVRLVFTATWIIWCTKPRHVRRIQAQYQIPVVLVHDRERFSLSRLHSATARFLTAR